MKRTTQKMYAVLLTFVMLCGCLIIPTPATVEAAGNTKLKVTSAKTVVAGKTIKIKTNVKAKFKSSNKKIATVSSKGVVKGKKAGKVKITITSKSNKKQKKVIKITVKKKPNTTITTEKPTPAPNPKPTTEAPSTKPTTEAPTTEAPTTESPTTENPTTEEPKMVGITAKYRGEKVPKGSEIDEYGIDITEIYSDGTTKKGEYYRYHTPDVSENFTEETAQDGKVYRTYTVSYLGFTTPLKVEVIDVGDTLYPMQFVAIYQGKTIKKGELPNVDDISATITWSDTQTFTEPEKSKLDLKFFGWTENNDMEYYVVYNYTFEYNGEELYVCVRRIMSVPCE